MQWLLPLPLLHKWLPQYFSAIFLTSQLVHWRVLHLSVKCLSTDCYYLSVLMVSAAFAHCACMHHDGSNGMLSQHLLNIYMVREHESVITQSGTTAVRPDLVTTDSVSCVTVKPGVDVYSLTHSLGQGCRSAAEPWVSKNLHLFIDLMF
jgi:hypothetical protein